MKDIAVGNVVLPNKPLSNIELMDASRKLKIPNFCGVYLRDTLPRKPKRNECGIMNLDSSNGMGTHWVAWHKKGQHKYYFDSYGLPPPTEMIEYLGRGTPGDSGSSVSVDGVSLSYINNNFLRRDGTNTATGSIDMTGNTLTNVSNPVNNQDAATKYYVDTIARGVDDKVNKSGDTKSGNLNMNGNRILGVAEVGGGDDTSQAIPFSQINQMLNTATGVAIRESNEYTDDEAVKKTGDTMTGDLMLTSGSRKIGQEDLINGQSFQISMGNIFNRIFCEHFPDEPNKETPVTVWGSDGFKVQVGGIDVIRIGSNDNTNIDVHNNKVTNIAEPTNTQDAPTKAYVDSRKPMVAVWAEENEWSYYKWVLSMVIWKWV
ncbi:hypothetical protein CAPTEDRAFT_213857 [Capitella teleta]|uniref:Uncharacterized protein n=1 Tax=Capitella teleta TaxID=283909 RepID=R7V5P3_CAPTE|nr:hypothetical protein CAPTEDRAFT_213857 [Capitella teleta]|eukprot:ELU13787.1 hypothetical protein CAPTEDRAFT_213857 [Capitella teleta]